MDWCRIYVLKLPDEEEAEHTISIQENSVPCITIDYAFNYHMIRLEKEFSVLQYQLACLSTFGGAYHLLNRPLKALQVAYQQEIVGRRFCSTEIIVRSKVFQAVNFMLLGNKHACHRCFQESRALAQYQDHLLHFVSASEGWLSRNHGYKLRNAAPDTASIGDISSSTEST